jgi:hypothetical protein
MSSERKQISPKFCPILFVRRLQQRIKKKMGHQVRCMWQGSDEFGPTSLVLALVMVLNGAVGRTCTWAERPRVSSNQIPCAHMVGRWAGHSVGMNAGLCSKWSVYTVKINHLWTHLFSIDLSAYELRVREHLASEIFKHLYKILLVRQWGSCGCFQPCKPEYIFHKTFIQVKHT